MSKKKIYRIHKISGLTLGFFIFLLALSGSIITFRAEIMPKVYPEFHITPGLKELPVETLLLSAKDHLGETKIITNLYTAEDKESSFLVLFKDPEKLLPGILAIDPYTGKVKAEMAVWQNAFAVMLFFHANFFLGKIGSYMVGILGAVLLFFVFSGIYIWLPKHGTFQKLKRLFTLQSKNQPQNIHHTLGLILVIPLFISAMTGFLTVFDLAYPIGKMISGDPTRIEEIEKIGSCNFRREVQALNILSEFQRANLISIHLCGKKNSLVKATFGLHDRHFLQGYGRILIDAETNAIVQTIRSDVDPKSWNIKRLIIFPIHSGEYFGMPGRVINLITGLGLMLIFISGVWLAMKRRKKTSLSLEETGTFDN